MSLATPSCSSPNFATGLADAVRLLGSGQPNPPEAWVKGGLHYEGCLWRPRMLKIEAFQYARALS